MGTVPQVKPLRRSFIRFPTQVEFGAGMLKRLGEFTADYGKKAFCLFDPFFKGSEAAQTAVEALHAVGIETYECYNVHPNPRAGDIDAVTAECKEQSCDFVVSMGGGGTVDIGKAKKVSRDSVEHLARHSEMITHLPEEDEMLIPLIAVEKR